jgi:hypothetical protein
LFGNAQAEGDFSGEMSVVVKTINGGYEAVVSQGTLKRDIKAKVTLTKNTKSQFYSMLEAEENYHKAQFEGTVYSKAMEDIAVVENIIKEVASKAPFIAVSAEDAKRKAEQAIDDALAHELERTIAKLKTVEWRCQLEREAKSKIGASFKFSFKCTYAKHGCDLSN